MPTIKRQVSTEGSAAVKREQTGKASYDHWDVLSAYEAGKKAGIQMRDAVYKKAFEDNFDKSVEACREIYALLIDKGIECRMVLIKPESITEFELLFAVEKNRFNSAEFAKIYPLASDKIRGIASKTLELSTSFMPYSKDINGELLDSDGFLTIYNGKKS